MSKPILSLLASAAFLSACSAAAGTVDAGPPPVVEPAALAARVEPVSCDVRITRTRHGASLEAVASSGRAFDGEYSFSIVKSGANSSEINQGGPVSLHAGERVALADNEISIGRSERVRAELTLSDAHGGVCRDEVRL